MDNHTNGKLNKRPLIILTGPTAVGKTALSIKLAKAVNGQMISADSMQVYRKMDIGTAKITREEMQGIPHYLIDVLDPAEDFNVVMFQKMAKEALEKIYAEGAIPIIVGGTGFYIQALLYDINFEENDGDTAIRVKYQALADENGPEYVHQLLRDIDPVSADEIHANNVKRVIRALEFYEQTGHRMSEHNMEQKQRESAYNSCYFVLNDDRKLLYDRIERRIDIMLEQGLVNEVRSLKEQGYTRIRLTMQRVRYKEILAYLENEISLDEAIYILKRDTRHFAKRQLTWFKRERDVIWLSRTEYQNDEAILDEMIGSLQKSGIL